MLRKVKSKFTTCGLIKNNCYFVTDLNNDYYNVRLNNGELVIRHKKAFDIIY